MDTLKPPGPMNFGTGNVSDAWKRWKQQWNLYSKASGADSKSEDVQCAIFLHVIGEEGIELFNTFDIPADDKDKISPLLKLFEDYCNPKKNITFERYKFNARNQKDGEPCDQYVTELKTLAQSCDFKDLKEELIRDRIVIGLYDGVLRARLLRETDLTLTKTISMCRTHEASQEHLKSLEAASSSSAATDPAAKQDVSVVKKRSNYRQKSSQQCDSCGYAIHTRSECPAEKKECHICRMKGHFARKCPDKVKKSIREVTSNRDKDDVATGTTYFLGSVDIDDAEDEPPWRTDLRVNGARLNWKIDCGADVTVISSKSFRRIRHSPRLKPTNVKLDSPGGPLKCLGQFIARIEGLKGSAYVRTFVVESKIDNLLGRGAAVRLQLIARLDNVQTDGQGDELSDFDVFGELGELKGHPVKIRVRPNAQPYGAGTARRVAIPQMEKVKTELSRMERLGVIVRVTQPTEWCSPMVVVPKANTDKIRICVDLKKLNTEIQREKYILPTILPTSYTSWLDPPCVPLSMPVVAIGNYV